MAITLLAAPDDPFAATSDWTDLLAQMAAGQLNWNGPISQIDFDNDLVLKGAIFNIGGAIYKATSDTSITGTPSDYVKLTHSGSSATASYVASPTLTWSDTWNGWYDGSSYLHIFDELKAYLAGVITTVHYSLGKTLLNNSTATFSKYRDGLTISSGELALCALSSTSVAFIDATNEELRKYDWNGSTWELDGSALSISGIGSPALTTLSSTSVAFIDDTLESLRKYDWNGSTWAIDGSGLSISGIDNPSLGTLSSTSVAFIDGTLKSLRKYDFGGSTWALDGSGLTISGVSGNTVVTGLDSTSVAYIDPGNQELRKYDWGGSSWSLDGSGLDIGSIGSPALSSFSSTSVAFIDATNDSLRMYNWSGTVWSEWGDSLDISAVSLPKLAALDRTSIAFMDATNDELRKYNIVYLLNGINLQ